MANFSFGDVDEIVCQHPTGEFRFFPKANESGTGDLGGHRANDDANQITSNGQMMSQINRVRGSFEVPISVETDLTAQKNLANLGKHPDLGTWTISFINGTVMRGKGRPVGDQQLDTNAGTMTLKIAVEKFETL